MILLSLWRWSLCFALLLATFVTSLPVHEDPEDPSNILARQDRACRNTPYTRMCWEAGFSIATDFDAKAPPAGKTVTHNLEITNTTLAPDGVSRLVMAVNGQYPGPALTASWGDTMVINVKNSLQHNGTSVHFHGVRQLNSNQQDGSNGVTECPIAPGETKQYRFRCTQFGTGWYHSHFSAQYGDGVVGPIVIDGPATSNYDEDLGPMSLTDWYYDTAFTLHHRYAHTTNGPAVPPTGLINGMMKSAQGGQYHVTRVKKGKKYRLRLINTGINQHFHVSIDNHKLTVIASDFVPIKPYVTDSVSIGIGQRHDVVFHANQDAGNYWIRADIGNCGRNANAGNIRSIVRYEGASTSDPTTSGVSKDLSCRDESVRPYVDNTVPRDQFSRAVRRLSTDFNVDTSDGRLVQWLINGSDIRVDWEKPTLQYVLDGNSAFPDELNLYEINGADEWSFWVIQSVQDDPFNTEHPIHLHGHDFYVLGQGTGVWDGDSSNLMFANPPRRDTAQLPARGYLILGFPMDNPGAWLMHCHIPWHVGQGFSHQFLERKDEILGAIGDMSSFSNGCDSWRSYWHSPARVYEQEDSGL
ncbi:laccase-like multicopper oxidase [Hortaea werneckii]|nr:laccase-like multicopper oxidase [Hortaea werneckii]